MVTPYIGIGDIGSSPVLTTKKIKVMIYWDLLLLAVHVVNAIMFKKRKDYNWSNLSWFFAGWQLALTLQHLKEALV